VSSDFLKSQRTTVRYPTDFLIGDLLVKAGVIRANQLDEAVRLAGNKKINLGQMLVIARHLTNRDLQAAVDAQSAIRDRKVDMNTAVRALKSACRAGISFSDALRDNGQAQQVTDGPTNRLGELLLEAGVIDRDQFAKAMQRSLSTGLPLGRILVLNGAINEILLTAALEIQVRVRDEMMTREEALGYLRSAGSKSDEEGISVEQALQIQSALKSPRGKAIRLGELLVLAGMLHDSDVINALELALSNDLQIGQVIVNQGFITPELLDAALQLQELVDKGLMDGEQAAESLKEIQSGALGISDVVEYVESNQGLPTEVDFAGLLTLSRIVSVDDIVNAFDIARNDPEIVAAILCMTGHMNELAAGAALRCFSLISSNHLNQDDAIVALDFCLQKQGEAEITFDEALQELGWSIDQPLATEESVQVEVVTEFVSEVTEIELEMRLEEMRLEEPLTGDPTLELEAVPAGSEEALMPAVESLKPEPEPEVAPPKPELVATQSEPKAVTPEPKAMPPVRALTPNKPGAPLAKPAIAAATPSTSAAKPLTPAAKPLTPAAKPVIPAAKPEAPAAKVETPAAKVETPAPKAATPEPVKITPEPIAVAKEPVAATPEPEVAKPEPEIVAEEPKAELPESVAIIEDAMPELAKETVTAEAESPSREIDPVSTETSFEPPHGESFAKEEESVSDLEAIDTSDNIPALVEKRPHLKEAASEPFENSAAASEISNALSSPEEESNVVPFDRDAMKSLSRTGTGLDAMDPSDDWLSPVEMGEAEENAEESLTPELAVDPPESILVESSEEILVQLDENGNIAGVIIDETVTTDSSTSEPVEDKKVSAAPEATSSAALRSLTRSKPQKAPGESTGEEPPVTPLAPTQPEVPASTSSEAIAASSSTEPVSPNKNGAGTESGELPAIKRKEGRAARPGGTSSKGMTLKNLLESYAAQSGDQEVIEPVQEEPAATVVAPVEPPVPTGNGHATHAGEKVAARSGSDELVLSENDQEILAAAASLTATPEQIKEAALLLAAHQQASLVAKTENEPALAAVANRAATTTPAKPTPATTSLAGASGAGLHSATTAPAKPTPATTSLAGASGAGLHSATTAPAKPTPATTSLAGASGAGLHSATTVPAKPTPATTSLAGASGAGLHSATTVPAKPTPATTSLAGASGAGVHSATTVPAKPTPATTSLAGASGAGLHSAARPTGELPTEPAPEISMGGLKAVDQSDEKKSVEQQTELTEKDEEVSAALGDAFVRLAESYYEQGNYAESEKLYRRILSLKETEEGLKSPTLLSALSNLAGVLCVQGKFEEAEIFVHRSVNILETHEPDNILKLADGLNTLAGIYYQQEKFEQCEPLLERALRLRQRALGEDHPDIADNLRDYAKFLKKVGRAEEAEKMYAQAKAILAQALKKATH
jgi:Tfp pilus assembly protein PilF